MTYKGNPFRIFQLSNVTHFFFRKQTKPHIHLTSNFVYSLYIYFRIRTFSNMFTSVRDSRICITQNGHNLSARMGKPVPVYTFVMYIRQTKCKTQYLVCAVAQRLPDTYIESICFPFFSPPTTTTIHKLCRIAVYLYIRFVFVRLSSFFY